MKRKEQGVKKSRAKKIIFWLAVLVGIIVIAAAVAPFIMTAVSDYSNSLKYKSYPIGVYDPVNVTDPNIAEKNPNYELNISSDRKYEISSASWIDYRPREGPGFWPFTSDAGFTEFGEPYGGGIKIVVTDLNGTAIPGIPLIVTAYAKYTGPDRATTTLIGAGAGVAAGALVGGGPLGALVGGAIGAIGGYLFGGLNPSSKTALDSEMVMCDSGEGANEYLIGDPFGYWYSDRHMQIVLPEDLLNYYSDFAVTTEITFNYNAIIYVRLGSDTQRLLDIQQEILEDDLYQGMKTSETFESWGYWDDDYGAITSDVFYALDTTNLTGEAGEFFKPKVSLNDNDVYIMSERRLVATRNLAGITGIGGYYIFLNGTTIINPETYAITLGVFALDNTTNVWPPASNSYYIFEYSCVLDTEARGYKFLPLVYYDGTLGYETLGETEATFGHSEYVTEFAYKYSLYYSAENQTVHRVIYDLNDRIPLVCDFNSPLYLNGTETFFTFRYFLATPGQLIEYEDTGIGADTFAFTLRVLIYDNNDTYADESAYCEVGYNAIGQCKIDVDLEGSGLKDLTSYGCQVWIISEEDKSPLGPTRYTCVYSEALYYLLRNFDEFMNEVQDMEDLIASLRSKEDVGEGTYAAAKEIMSLMKTKVSDVEDSLNDLEGKNPEIARKYLEKVRKSVECFKGEYVMLMTFMDGNSPDSVSKSGPLFVEFRSMLIEINFFYSDTFTQYNAYVAALNGETGIADDIDDITKGARDDFIKRYNERRNSGWDKILPLLVILLTLLISGILALIVYFMFREKFKSKAYLYIFTFAVFAVTAIVIYFVLLSISTTILYWYYGV